MAYARKVNEAGLFANTLHPDKSDFNAQIDVQCGHCEAITSFWINGWKKVTKTGGKYISLSLRPKAMHSRSAAGATANDGDDIPW
jgi:hypothetical protein